MSLCMLGAEYSWRRGAHEEALNYITRHCARTYVSGSMPDSERAVLVAPSSPVPSIDGCQIEQFCILTNEDEVVPKLHDHRLALEQEVANLKEKLANEIKLREALKGGLQRTPGTLPKIPGYVPAKMRKLLFDVAVLEEEVTFLEKHTVYLQEELEEKKGSESPRTQHYDRERSNSNRPQSLRIDIPEFSEPSVSTQSSEPVTPMTAAGTSAMIPPLRNWGGSTASSPSPRHEGYVPLPLPAPPAITLPVPMPSPSPVHTDEPNGVPNPTLNRKRVIRRGSSSSESISTDFGEQRNAVGKPSKKKPHHKKSASLSSSSKVEIDGDLGSCRPSPIRKHVDKEDVYRRLSIPKNGGYLRASPLPSPPEKFEIPGYDTLRRSTSLKDFEGKYSPLTDPSPSGMVDGRGKASLRRPFSKESHGRSPPVASPQFENTGARFLRRSHSSKESQAGSSPGSNPSPVFEDKGIASIKRTVSSTRPAESLQRKLEKNGSFSFSPSPEKKENHACLVTPFKLPPTMEKENLMTTTTIKDERQRTHDLVISKSLPRIKLTKVASKIPTRTLFSGKEGLQQHLLFGNDGEKNNFAENAKLYVLANTKTNFPGTPTKQGFKVRPVQVQKSISKVGDKQSNSLKLERKVPASTNKLSQSRFHDDEEDDKVGMACGPIADAAWLSEDLARLLGSVCSRIRWHSSAADAVTTRMLVKRPLPLLGNPEKAPQFQRSQSFDIKSSGGLKLLQEYCSDDMDMSDTYDMYKNRRAEDVGPHRHYYKAVKLPLEQKLKT